MRFLRKHSHLLVWCLFYLLVVYTTTQSFFYSEHEIDLDIFLFMSLFRVQMYYFNTVVFFISYLYVIKKTFSLCLFYCTLSRVLFMACNFIRIEGKFVLYCLYCSLIFGFPTFKRCFYSLQRVTIFWFL